MPLYRQRCPLSPVVALLVLAGFLGAGAPRAEAWSATVLQVQGRDLFVSSRGTNAVKRYDGSTGAALDDFVLPNTAGLSVTQEVAFGPDGRLYVSGRGNTHLLQFDGQTGAFLGNFTSGYDLDEPTKMTFGPDGLLYVSQWGQQQSNVVFGPAPEVAPGPAFTKVLTGVVTTDGANSQGASWIDYDNDDDLDLLVANVGTQVNFLYRNTGDGNFERATAGALGADVLSQRGNCWADYDNDGDLDVFVTGREAAFYENDGHASFARLNTVFGTTDLRSWACAWADYDLDGFVDLVLTHPNGFVGTPPLPNFLFRNRGDGTFEAVTDTPITMGLAPYTVPTWADYDQDGDQDLFIGSGPATATPGPDFLYRNQLAETGTATFERILDGPLATTNRDGQVINWIDYDNDGDLDVYVTNWGGGMGGRADELYRNDEGVLTKITTGSIVTDRQVSLSSVWGDFDNDGDLDALVTDGSTGQPNRFYDNNGDGTFTRLTTAPFTTDRSVSWGATDGDYDDDGDLDLFVANAADGTRNFLYRNDLTNGYHWLKVKVVGTASNRAGIGAKLRAKATIQGQAVWQQRDVSSQNSFNGHNSLIVHFGLGDAALVDSLRIEWPSGQVDVFTDVTVDQFLEAVEGTTISPVPTEAGPIVPSEVVLSPNYPNPFTASTTMQYRLSRAAFVRLTVYDVLGRVVATLVNGQQGPGAYTVSFEAGALPGGVYLYRLQAGRAVQQRKMILIF